MRGAAIGLALVVAVCLGIAGYATIMALAGRRARRRLARARWRVRHYAAGGQTVVAVSLIVPVGRAGRDPIAGELVADAPFAGEHVLEEHVVDRINDADPRWADRFLRAREEAEERSFHLNADRPT